MNRISAGFVLLIALLLEVNAINIDTPTCAKLQCTATNGQCGSIGSSNFVCPATQYCKQGTCTDYLQENESCVIGGPVSQCGHLQCQANTTTNTATCLPAVYKAYPGESCTSDGDCYYLTSQGTTNSTCVAGLCFGKQVNDPCEHNVGQCVKGLFCSSASVCTSLKLNGEVCSSRWDCASGSCIPQSANSTDGVCGQFESVNAGGACEGNEDCVAGLSCNRRNATDKWGNCESVVGSSYKMCTQASDCAYPETCTCNSLTGGMRCVAPAVRPSGLPDAELISGKCTVASNCTGNTTCVLSACSAELCKYFSVLYGPTIWNSNIVSMECVYGEMAVSAYSACYPEEENSGPDYEKEELDSGAEAMLLVPFLTMGAVAFVVILAF